MDREFVVNKVLELVSCAEDYGFKKGILLTGLAELIELKLEDKEIEKYCKWFLSSEAKSKGYSKEDYNLIKYELMEFKQNYIIK